MAFADRLTPARADLAAKRLEGLIKAGRFVEGTAHRVSAALLDLTLTPEPGAELATQLLHGEAFTVYETRGDGLAWGQSDLDGYVGYVAASGLGPYRPDGRRITALSSHRYAAAALRARVTADLPHLADVAVAGEAGEFVGLGDGGFVPAPHLRPTRGDFVDHALRFIGAPYLWGGRSARGLDCSALIQLALMGVGAPAPRDTDMQVALLGAPPPDGAPPRRGDLMFWRGHVGVLIDATTLLHANAHHMAVAVEPFAPAAARIAAAGGGPVTARRRLGSAGRVG